MWIVNFLRKHYVGCSEQSTHRNPFDNTLQQMMEEETRRALVIGFILGIAFALFMFRMTL